MGMGAQRVIKICVWAAKGDHTCIKVNVIIVKHFQIVYSAIQKKLFNVSRVITYKSIIMDMAIVHRAEDFSIVYNAPMQTPAQNAVKISFK